MKLEIRVHWQMRAVAVVDARGDLDHGLGP